MIKLLDSHFHPQLMSNPEQGIANAVKEGVRYLLAVSVEAEDNVKLASYKEYCAVHHKEVDFQYSFGIHPCNDNSNYSLHNINLPQPKDIMAIGETGLDAVRTTCSIVNQDKLLREHIELSIAWQKPLILHIRQAHQDAVRVLKTYSGITGIVHCFEGNWEEAKKYLDLGLYISFSGLVTYPNNQAIAEVAKLMPTDRILTETDSPFLTPYPLKRSSSNYPGNVIKILQCISQHRNTSDIDLSKHVINNYLTLFKNVKHS